MLTKRLGKILKVRSIYHLNNLFDFLDYTYDINNGGCCYVAYCLAKLLEKDGIDYTLLICTPGYKCNKLDELEDSCEHYALRVNECIINDAGFSFDAEIKTTAAEIYNHYNKHKWNTDYDYEKNPFINKIIKIFYNDFTSYLREE